MGSSPSYENGLLRRDAAWKRIRVEAFEEKTMGPAPPYRVALAWF
jgi:hypothetical protein